jgi:peptidoglycan/LPS O-acetylase OafA/YrhL
MKSTSGSHFIALDHVRALAAFMVFTWHFIHGESRPVPGHAPAVFPLALLDQGHTGVALFMALSGYLFAKLLDGKSINYKSFIWNRVLRLVPLLVVVVIVDEIVFGGGNGGNLFSYAYYYACFIARSAILPILPNGGWSITVEFHYYAILPLFLWMIRKSKWMPISIIVVAVALRSLIYLQRGELRSLAYWTIIGRIDQFALGMLIFQFRNFMARRHAIAILIMVGFALFYWYLDFLGGFFDIPEPIWIILPTVEGLAYAIAIAWYDNSFVHSTAGVSRFIGRIGEYSYSIYLFHAFVVFRMATLINEHVIDISNFYVACVMSAVCFLLMIPPGYLSFRFIEAPFLKLRKPYVISLRSNEEMWPQVVLQPEQVERPKCVAEL